MTSIQKEKYLLIATILLCDCYYIQLRCYERGGSSQKGSKKIIKYMSGVKIYRKKCVSLLTKLYLIMKGRLSYSLLIMACNFLFAMNACGQATTNDIVAEGETPVRVSDSYSFTEGPATDAKGDVFFTDQPNNKIYHWDCESGEISVFTDQSGRSNGMYFDAQGNLIACADMDNQLLSLIHI